MSFEGDARREIAREADCFRIRRAVGDVFEQPVVADAIEAKIGSAELLIERVGIQSERLAAIVLSKIADCLNPKRAKRGIGNRIGCCHVNRNRKPIANFDRQPQPQRDPQTIGVITRR